MQSRNWTVLIHRPNKEGRKMNMLIQTLVRQAMIVLGTWLVTKGVIQDAQVEALAGIAIAVASFVWRYIELRSSAKKLAAKEAPAEVPMAK